MVRPSAFTPNPQTAADNAFQRRPEPGIQAQALARKALDEVNAAAAAIASTGVTVHLFEDAGHCDTPDSVFPNNWFSTHAGGYVALYPMYSPNRRRERRTDVINFLKTRYRVQEVTDYSGLETDGLWLEGTGAMVLDHVERVAYTARSNRADAVVLERFATRFNYEPMLFDATDTAGQPVYHTNVLMCIATDFVLMGTDMIHDTLRRNEIVQRLTDSGRQVIALSDSQIHNFAGNALELWGNNRRWLALSSRALRSLRPDQITLIEQSATLLPLDIPTIELAGGSVRCMLAGIHLTPRPTPPSIPQ
jgi:hypothetical protein